MPPLKTYFADGLQATFSTLRTLSLSVSFFQSPSDEDLLSSEWKLWLPRVVSMASKLQNLSLTFDGWPAGEFGLGMADNATGFEAFAREVQLPNLTSLELRNTEASPVALYLLSPKVKRTLIDLKLHHVQLPYGCKWLEVLYTLWDQELPSLYDVKLSWLMESKFLGSSRVVVFNSNDIDNCEKCRNNTDDMPTDECKRVTRVMTSHEMDDLQVLDTIQEEAFH